MAFKRTLAQRFFNVTKLSSQSLTNCRISSSSVSPHASERNIAPDPGDNAVLRRFQPEIRSHPLAGSILQRLKEMDISRNRIRLDILAPPAAEGVSVEDVKKLLKVAQMELVKSKLRETRKVCISFSEFIRICDENCSDHDQAVRIAKMLDESAAVIVLGDMVLLRPEQQGIETFLFRKFHV